jgi:predicted esterase
MNKIFHLSSDEVAEVSKHPSHAWDLYPATKIDLWEIPQLQTDKNNLWDVEFIPCYTSQYFCVLVRIDQTGLESKDRAYQNGGGFVFQLAQPRTDNELTDVFTVFGASPLEKREELQWTRLFVYYKDIDLAFTKVEDGEVVVETDDNHTYMLVMAPWHYAEPLGPFLTKKIGFTIIVPQPIEAEYPCQYYSLIPGWKTMAEQELRDYVVYELEEPETPSSGLEIEFSLGSKHYRQGVPGVVRLAVNSSCTDGIDVTIGLGKRELVAKNFDLSEGLNTFSVEFDTGLLDTGRTQLELNLSTSEVQYSHQLELLIIDNERISKIREKVSRLSQEGSDEMMRRESLVTLEWLLESLYSELDSLKPHQEPQQIENLITRLDEGLRRVESGESLFIKGERLRLGLRSKQDSTLQPYSLYIPPTFEEGKSGLIVLLHGSATDDERTLEKAEPLEKYDKTRMIIVAPLARGESHYYLPDEAIQEIVEITEKMIEMFSVPKKKVVLVGFSMGGFGVLNTFFHRPDLYRNLVLLSGSMKAYEEMEVVKDFTTEESLRQLAKTNLIIFHGSEDLNVRYKELKPVHERLKELNPDIEIHVAEGVGHRQPPEWQEKMIEIFERIDRYA